jgi:hypothetical protein
MAQKKTHGEQAQQPECGFCHTLEHGKHGPVQREWSWEWMMHIPVCRKHTLPTYEKWQADKAKYVQEDDLWQKALQEKGPTLS